MTELDAAASVIVMWCSGLMLGVVMFFGAMWR